MEREQLPPLTEGSQLAAIDLGSNSFHLIIARLEHGEMRPMETLAEKVQLGAGLIDELLSQEAIDRGLDCLARFAQLLDSIEPERIRVVGTNALRVARNRRAFTGPAGRILGTPVEVIYGREEARLVYLGAAHSLADDAQSRLVVDIGGGSTEFIVGERFEPQRMESLQLGCVSYTQEFFPDGTMSADRFRQAYDRARLESSHIRYNYHAGHWAECVGSSGTLQAIEAILSQNDWSESGIDRAGLTQLQQHLLKYEQFDDIELSGLSQPRRNVIVAGVAITCALFDVLRIETMRTSKGALREGVIYDLMGRLTHEDVRERSVNALMQRYSVDADIADMVERRARTLFLATRANWQLRATDWELLQRAARTHEIGMAISHRQYNRHSAYVIRNADLPGFSQEEQEQLALLVQAHRGKLDAKLWLDFTETDQPRLLRLITILRLAALFKYVEQLGHLPAFAVQVGSESLELEFADGWLDEHPLTARDLEHEQGVLAKFAMALEIR